MIKGRTSTGFDFEIDERVVGDYKLVELSVAMINGTDEQQSAAMVGMVNFIFNDGGEALKAHIRELNDGFCPCDAIADEVSEILNFNPTTKK